MELERTGGIVREGEDSDVYYHVRRGNADNRTAGCGAHGWWNTLCAHLIWPNGVFSVGVLHFLLRREFYFHGGKVGGTRCPNCPILVGNYLY